MQHCKAQLLAQRVLRAALLFQFFQYIFVRRRDKEPAAGVHRLHRCQHQALVGNRRRVEAPSVYNDTICHDDSFLHIERGETFRPMNLSRVYLICKVVSRSSPLTHMSACPYRLRHSFP